MIIAIDGPAGSGKSTVAKLVAQRLGFAYLDTGAMYRAVAFRALKDKIDLSEPLSDDATSAIRKIASTEQISFGFVAGEPVPSKVMIAGEDVTQAIRTAQVDKAVSPVSADFGVRLALTKQQQVFGADHDTVMEGRDIGTVVFPAAECKVYLTASAEERAHRRALQNAVKSRGSKAKVTQEELEAVLKDILRRDDYDSSRTHAPLAPATDAWQLDSTNFSIDEVVEQIVKYCTTKQV